MQLFTGIKVMSQFLSELIKNPRFIRAVAPSSQSLAEKMIEKIDFKQILCIIEYGPGTGFFTEKLIVRYLLTRSTCKVSNSGGLMIMVNICTLNIFSILDVIMYKL